MKLIWDEKEGSFKMSKTAEFDPDDWAISNGYQFECIVPGTKQSVNRLKVQGGWIYHIKFYGESPTSCFVPDNSSSKE
jgi:hypothetical protein